MPGLALMIGLALWAALFLRVPGTQAAQPAELANALGAAPPPPAGVSNEECLQCHSKRGQVLGLPSGEDLYLTIDPDGFAASVHGQAGYACVQCHTNIREYPHPEFTAQDRREATLALYPACKSCHSGNYELTLDSVHQRALENGDRNAAVCSDCHNPHYQPRLTDRDTHELRPVMRNVVPQTCARCHSAIYNQYKSSVHGSVLMGGGITDTPTCTDCHGVHNIQDPTTVAFRVSTPELCARCHTNAELMGKYGISTDVLNTYLADFHGTTVTLFERTAPGQQTNKPVCTDCHGIHDIKRADDPDKGLHIKANLLQTCQRCHPDAAPNFPDSWLSHYIPSPEKNSLVYYVNVFYKFFVPSVLIGMAGFVAADAGRRVLDRRKKDEHP